MFGVLRGSTCGFTPAEREEWVSHVCGLCLTLRDRQGQTARMVTSFDAALLSVVHDAHFEPEALPRGRHFCALRSFTTATVVTSASPGARHAAAMSLLMAATKIDDHVDDRQGWVARVGGAAHGLARIWRGAARRHATRLGFATTGIETAVAEQAAVESGPVQGFMACSAPTERATGQAFRHVATLVDRPAHATPLFEIGRMFGRIVYLLDASTISTVTERRIASIR